ncbi:MAG: nucleoside monophosphate kinase [Phycisphaeraceae bacterium]|nr:nucleoside monophosphate kinase [Phycisphaerales bacterium]MCB9860763.1 nucleoside monophosphate kinase [Phycisphaeraceae bacterium]
MSDRYKSILLFGAPGVGKGTQGALLAKVPGFHHLSTGEMFRNMDRGSELGRVFTQYSHRGELVPDELTIRLWGENVNARRTLGLYKPDRDILLLDGIPRTTAQARLMEGRIEVLGIVHLTTSDPEVMVKRLRDRALKEGRVDDADEKTIRRRFEVYQNETRPMLEHYTPELVHDVEAVGSPAYVLLNILQAIVPVLEQAGACSCAK